MTPARTAQHHRSSLVGESFQFLLYAGLFHGRPARTDDIVDLGAAVNDPK